MGYYTNCNLQAFLPDTERWHYLDDGLLSEQIAAAVEQHEYLSACWNNWESQKLHESEDTIKPELTKLSAQFPNLVFEFTGEGEERDDNWKLWAMAGHVQLVPGSDIWGLQPKTPLEAAKLFAKEATNAPA